MIRAALVAGHFGKARATFPPGLQYHLGGRKTTRQLASLVAPVFAAPHLRRTGGP
jgi:hypothetical protein